MNKKYTFLSHLLYIFMQMQTVSFLFNNFLKKCKIKDQLAITSNKIRSLTSDQKNQESRSNDMIQYLKAHDNGYQEVELIERVFIS